MLNVFLSVVLFIFFNLIYVPYVHASINSEVREFLDYREQLWPNWNLSHLISSNIQNDLIYPSWFEGDWVVYSQDLNDISKDAVKYIVRFTKNESGQIVGDRANNSESIGKAILGDKLKKVKSDPNSFNNQIIYLNDNEFIESRVTARNQIFDDELFFADEFFIQSFHKSGVSRLNQVETMSKFYKCNNEGFQSSQSIKTDICGFQYQATYGSKVGSTNQNAISTNKYKLNFRFIGTEH